VWDGRISQSPPSTHLPILPLPLESPPSLQPVFSLAHFAALRELLSGFIFPPRRQARKGPATQPVFFAAPTLISLSLANFAPLRETILLFVLFSRQDAKLAKAPPPNRFFFAAPTLDFSELGALRAFCGRIVSSLFHRYALIALAISSLPPSMRPTTTANTMFIGIMMPLKANMGTVTSVPAK
jgi:hypothetical protein